MPSNHADRKRLLLLLIPSVLAPCATSINVNQHLLSIYIDRLLPEITEPGDDGNYGSAGMYDVVALQVCVVWRCWF